MQRQEWKGPDPVSFYPTTTNVAMAYGNTDMHRNDGYMSTAAVPYALEDL
jgi:hypothetical protein